MKKFKEKVNPQILWIWAQEISKEISFNLKNFLFLGSENTKYFLQPQILWIWVQEILKNLSKIEVSIFEDFGACENWKFSRLKIYDFQTSKTCGFWRLRIFWVQKIQSMRKSKIWQYFFSTCKKQGFLLSRKFFIFVNFKIFFKLKKILIF